MYSRPGCVGKAIFKIQSQHHQKTGRVHKQGPDPSGFVCAPPHRPPSSVDWSIVFAVLGIKPRASHMLWCQTLLLHVFSLPASHCCGLADRRMPSVSTQTSAQDAVSSHNRLPFLSPACLLPPSHSEHLGWRALSVASPAAFSPQPPWRLFPLPQQPRETASVDGVS